MNSEDTDVIFVPLSLSFSFVNPRHSYPPLRCLSTVPVQHIMRSYSDSHLFLKLAATTAVDGGICEDEDRTSWYSGGELWDMDYVQHWLRLDETRTAIQQRMEYDAAELEDWTMDDGAGWKRLLAADGKQQSLQCIEEDDGTSSAAAGGRRNDNDDDDLLSGSTKDVSWHHFQRSDHRRRRDLSLQQHQNGLDQRPAASESCGSGGECWSSADEYAAAESPPSKRSSSSCSDSVDLLPPPGPIAGTDFTRDFYRLVKFESSKSLASTSSRSVTGCEYRRPAADETQPDREQALQSVLDFIAEQQQYCLSRQAEDKPVPSVAGAGVCSDAATTAAVDRLRADDDDPVTAADRPTLSSDKLAPPATLQHQQTCDSNSCSDNLLNSKDSGLCGSDVEIECLPEDCYEASSPTATSTPRSTLLRTVPEEEDDEESAKSTSPQPPSTGAGCSSSVCTAETAVMASAWTATSSKDLIDQLNRMAGVRSPHDIEGGDLFGSRHSLEDDRTSSFPVADLQRHSPSSLSTTDLDEACCCPTGWVHLERDIDFADPKVRTDW